MWGALTIVAAAVMLAAPLNAEVIRSAADGFTVTLVRTVAAPPAAAYAALTQWGRWWSGEHSYSGKAADLTLDAHAGGCLCERWAGGEVAHGRVLMALPPTVLRLDAPLGPLMALPGKAVMTFTLTPSGTGTRIGIELRTAGSVADKYDALAAPVDAVLTLQADRLARLIDTGTP